MTRQISSARRAGGRPIEALGDAVSVECSTAVGHIHSMASSILFQADAAVPTPCWRRLRAERQEHRGRAELDLLGHREPDRRLGAAAIPSGPARQLHE